jgi:hypothetical protein
MFHIQDEGSVLRKLLGVFSIRPTFAQISSLVNNTLVSNMNYIPLSRTTFLRIPIINIKLPTFTNQATPVGSIDLLKALNQTDYFIENKMLVPKNKSVLFSRNVMFFYANRRYQSMNIANLAYKFSYTNVPYQTFNVGQTSVNDVPVTFNCTIPLGNDAFSLRSVVTVYRPPLEANISVGSSAIVLPKEKGDGEHFYYNPLLSNFMYDDGTKYASNKPISILYETPSGPNQIGFLELAQKYGTIFMYEKTA